jgi:NADP-dependent 3-hydroxy acid dehydrogenase YdfG
MAEKVFFITGGTSGIGEATARLATQSGHRVFITGRSQEKLAKIIASHPKMDGVVADASSWEETQMAVRRALDMFGRIDVGIANAGFTSTGNFATGDPEKWKDMVLTNVYGAALLAKATLPALEKTKGHFLLVGSVAGHKEIPGSLYSVTKWAVTGMAESLRQQVTGQGIRVTLISPGRVDTPFWNAKPAQSLTSEDIARTVMWAVDQPPHMDVNEILVRPVGQDV